MRSGSVSSKGSHSLIRGSSLRDERLSARRHAQGQGCKGKSTNDCRGQTWSAVFRESMPPANCKGCPETECKGCPETGHKNKKRTCRGPRTGPRFASESLDADTRQFIASDESAGNRAHITLEGVERILPKRFFSM